MPTPSRALARPVLLSPLHAVTLMLALVGVVGTGSTARGDDHGSWPEFRGPLGNGYADANNLPAQIDADRHVAWSTPIHGKGWSSPVIAENTVWLTTATEDGREMSVIAVALDSGVVLLDRVVYTNAEPAFCHPMNSYATPTPVVEQGRVYLHFGSYGTLCLDTHSYDTVWERRDLLCDHHRGPASSPILYKNLLIVAYDGFDVQYVVALDKETGATVWRQDRAIAYGTDNGDLKKAYCTASIIRVGEQDQLVYPSAVGTEVFEPETGRRLWTVYHDGMNASARPLYGHGLVFITNGMGSMVAVRADGQGDVTDTHIAWTSIKGVAKKSSQLLVGDKFYMIADNGVLSQRDARTGKIAWQQRLDGEFAASPIYAGGLIYLANTEGAIYTVRPGDEFQLVATSHLGDGYMASPAVVGDRLILRSKSTLYCVVAQ